jgi:hypothetical protein
MRNQPTHATPWEVEAARRREVIETDFGAAREARSDRVSRSRKGMGTARRFATWITGLTPTGGGKSTNRVERAPGCQPGVGAIEPGS